MLAPRACGEGLQMKAMLLRHGVITREPTRGAKLTSGLWLTIRFEHPAQTFACIEYRLAFK